MSYLKTIEEIASSFLQWPDRKKSRGLFDAFTSLLLSYQY